MIMPEPFFIDHPDTKLDARVAKAIKPIQAELNQVTKLLCDVMFTLDASGIQLSGCPDLYSWWDGKKKWDKLRHEAENQSKIIAGPHPHIDNGK